MKDLYHTEELLGLTALLDDLDETGPQLFDAGNVAGEDTHVTGLGGNVDLDAKYVKILD